MQIFGTSAAASAFAQAQAQPKATSNAGGSNPAGGGITSATDGLTSESTFLKLLVAQLQHQDPLNPTDSIQFVGQLVQYSELEQLMGINQGVQTLTGGTPTPPASNNGNSSS